jgi:hypothetical protein
MTDQIALTPQATETDDIRVRLISVALEWQSRFGVAPAITSAVSEYDAAMLVGMKESEYSADCIKRTAVTRGCDFTFQGLRYQVKANRPSGRTGSLVTLVGKANNYEWDHLIWILYDLRFTIREAWEWTVEAYRSVLGPVTRLSPAHMRAGQKLRCPTPH